MSIERRLAVAALSLLFTLSVSTPVDAVTIRQVEEAIVNAEAAGDFAAASRMRQKVQEAKVAAAEAAGDFAAASPMQQKVQEAKAAYAESRALLAAVRRLEQEAKAAAGTTGPSITEGAEARIAEARAKYDAYMDERVKQAKKKEEEMTIFDHTAYFFGFGEKAEKEREVEKRQSCARYAQSHYQEQLIEARSDPLLWQLGGYESAGDYAGSSERTFYRLCAR